MSHCTEDGYFNVSLPHMLDKGFKSPGNPPWLSPQGSLSFKSSRDTPPKKPWDVRSGLTPRQGYGEQGCYHNSSLVTHSKEVLQYCCLLFPQYGTHTSLKNGKRAARHPVPHVSYHVRLDCLFLMGAFYMTWGTPCPLCGQSGAK